MSSDGCEPFDIGTGPTLSPMTAGGHQAHCYALLASVSGHVLTLSIVHIICFPISLSVPSLYILSISDGTFLGCCLFQEFCQSTHISHSVLKSLIVQFTTMQLSIENAHETYTMMHDYCGSVCMAFQLSI
ncbi:hypothetical protein CEXT_124331 [Caerostris extrusa]|uniref:Uncharacterized protein n=1 Tax=Caerostris extrusa TaxID=172846 RepID=A0AAV4M9N9_CAEEX|nr:hypothetical protein CEXT_124331 [Caerostris extrusa]